MTEPAIEITLPISVIRAEPNQNAPPPVSASAMMFLTTMSLM